MSATVQHKAHQEIRQTLDACSPPVILRLRPAINLTPDQLLEISSLNDDLRFELTADGELVIKPLFGGETSIRSANILCQLGVWAHRDGTGIFLGSSAGFTLSNGATLSATASWVERSQVETLSREERRKIPALCPVFVVEVTTPSDRLDALKRKMGEWIDNGVRLGWLIDPDAKQVYVYRPHASVEQVDNPASVSGNPVLPGFTLDLREIW
jgi:Uma2 family endonuclease